MEAPWGSISPESPLGGTLIRSPLREQEPVIQSPSGIHFELMVDTNVRT
jgi:hypothetical protein